MSRVLKTHYPGSTVRITEPFAILTCSCGNRQWSLLGETMSCPKCGRMMEKEGEQGVSKQAHI